MRQYCQPRHLFLPLDSVVTHLRPLLCLYGCQLCVRACISAIVCQPSPIFVHFLSQASMVPTIHVVLNPACQISKTKLANAQGRSANCPESILPYSSPSILHSQLDSYLRYVKTIEIARKCGCRKAKKSSCPPSSYRDLLLR